MYYYKFIVDIIMYNNNNILYNYDLVVTYYYCY